MNTKSHMKTDVQRRTFLKGALAACCTLALPVLTGCGKREEPAPPAPTSGMTPPTMPQASEPSAEPSAPQTAAKLSKAQVQYQEQPKGDQQCSKCQHFIAESNTCKLVEGPINPNGWCTLFALRQS